MVVGWLVERKRTRVMSHDIRTMLICCCYDRIVYMCICVYGMIFSSLGVCVCLCGGREDAGEGRKEEGCTGAEKGGRGYGNVK